MNGYFMAGGQFRRSLMFWLPEAVNVCWEGSVCPSLVSSVLPNHRLLVAVRGRFSHFSLTQHGSFYFSVPQFMCGDHKGNGHFVLFLYHLFVSSPKMVLVLNRAKEASQEALERKLWLWSICLPHYANSSIISGVVHHLAPGKFR